MVALSIVAWQLWLVLLGSTALVAAALLFWHRTWVLNHLTPHTKPIEEVAVLVEEPAVVAEIEPETGPHVAIIINPIKNGADTFTNQIVIDCATANFPKPKFYETTVKSPGTRQAQLAIAEGADVIIAAGGDGTVRAVAAGMVHSGIPMGIIPLGTGNLLARNLDLPISSLEKLIEVALHGTARPIDVGWVQTTKSRAARVAQAKDAGRSAADAEVAELIELSEPSEKIVETAAEFDEPITSPPELFTVIAGVGFDAAMVADTDDKLKHKVGWIAYFMAAAHNMAYQRLKALVTIDDYPQSLVEARTIMVGNCGRLPGAITLLPNAKLDDGKIDVAAVDTKAGISGWAGLLGTVVLQGAGMTNHMYPKTGEIHFAQGKRVHIDLGRPAHAQVDGDLLGEIDIMEAWADEGALLIRCASPERRHKKDTTEDDATD